MCGIAGKFLLTHQPAISVRQLTDMIGIFRHRGPDETGIYLDDRIGLAHARLSIIDLAGGAQPIHNENQRFWIIFNGEIFNYLELRQDLLAKGHIFSTASDTEVILHLYETYGPDCLSRLVGQFALAIWDAEQQELFLARDRVGIRPLFYTVQKGCLIFASEIKAIFTDPAVERALNLPALTQIFTYWTTLPSETFFKNIRQLPPGHFLKASTSGIHLQKYWDHRYATDGDYLDLTETEITGRLHELLLDAVRLRLRADVPVGCYLSGGIDSSALTTLVKKHFNQSLKTFGITFESTDFDESGYQREMVNFLETDHQELHVRNEMLGAHLSQVIWHGEFPVLRTAPIPLFLLSGLVRENQFKVVLTGEGADEIFGGYNIFREAKVRNFWAKQPNSRFRGLLVRRLYPYIFKNPRLVNMQQKFFATGLEHPENPFFSHEIRWQNTARIEHFLTPELQTAAVKEQNAADLRALLPADFSRWDYLAKAQYLEKTLFMSNYLLSSQGDRVAMAHSVEIRLPFLDHRLIEFVGQIHPRWKIFGMTEKYILKKLFHGQLPASVLNRTKQPYRAPIGPELIIGHELAQALLSPAGLKKSGLFDETRVASLLQKMTLNKDVGEIEKMALAGIVTTQLCHHHFITDFPAQPIPEITLTRIFDNRSSR
jgi:asparagine synthase (glutamine-hydrolysing)